MTVRQGPETERALVLAAHGSRQSPAANALVRRLAESVRARRLFDQVAVAFHQGEPCFASVLDELTAGSVTVVPLFTSAGHYVETVLPAALKKNRRFSELRLRVTPPVGTHPQIPSLIARRLTTVLHDEQLARADTTVVVVGHGTRRHRQSRASTLHLAHMLRRRRVAGEVLAGFLDDDPPLDSVLREVTSRRRTVTSRRSPAASLIVVPFLLGSGMHALADIPGMLATGDWQLATGDRRLATVDRPLGDYPELVDIIIDLARRHPPPPPAFRPRGRAVRRNVGSVHLVGAGPGDAGLITVRGLKRLREADVVVHDRLIGPELLAEARADARLIDVGKGPGHAPYTQAAINRLLVEHARQGWRVVRLKGGDPFVFGRGSEEVAACRGAGVRVEVIPGITSAIAAPAAAGIPVTARGMARSFRVITGHEAERAEKAQEAERAEEAEGAEETLVILMGRATLRLITERLIAEGREPATPAVCIQSATTPGQRVTRATLGTIAAAVEQDGLESPVVTVVGAVAALGDGMGLLDLENSDLSRPQLHAWNEHSLQVVPRGAAI